MPIRSSRTLFFFLFVVSGFAGLIYESIWSHYLKLFLGHSAHAQTLVLAIFMGGMAVGAWWVSARSAQLRNLLLGYAVVEGIIGVLGLGFHSLSQAATQWAFDSVIPALGAPAAITAFKWLLGSVLILPQSILLGMTFPLMSGAIVRRFPQHSGETLAMLYFTNSFGAAVGVLASGFVMIGSLGLPGTIMTAGLMNLALALVVWGTSRSGGAEPAALASHAARGTDEAPRAARLRQLILFAAFATGAAAFLYEIAWLRMLALVLGSSTHAFELMLSAFILGIALGGLVIRRRIQRFRDPVRALGVVMLLMATVVLGTLHLYEHSFDWMAAIVTMFAPTDAGYLGFHLGSHAIALALMVPSSFFCGMTLPLMTQILLGAREGERAIGSVYAWNTVGSIAGIMLAVHLLMPQLGVKAVIVCGAVVHASLGIAFFVHGRQRWRAGEWSLAGAATLALLAALLLVQFDPRRMASGVYRDGIASYDADATVKYFRHGKTASISVIDLGGTVNIATNGKPDAAIIMDGPDGGPDEITMVLAGALPLGLHPQARTVANIGMGSGLTTHVLLASPTLTRVDTIEIEPAMVEGARIGFLPRVRRAFEDPRSEFRYEDAKTFFAGQQERYDVIVAEPSNPWVSGVASLFSVEFYRQLKSYLKPDGLLVQWLQIYETDESTVVSVLKALALNFTDFRIYRTDEANILIVAAPSGNVPRPQADALFTGAMKEELERVGITTLRDVEVRLIGDRPALLPALAWSQVPPNSDYFPYVDQHATRARVLKRDALAVSNIALHGVPVLDLMAGRPAPASSLGRFRGSDRSGLYELAEEARRSVAALEHGSEHLSAAAASRTAVLQAPGDWCKTASGTRAWLQAVFELALLANPTLSSGELDSLWSRLGQTPCGSSLSGGDALFLQLMRAISLRSSTDIPRLHDELAEATYRFGDPRQHAHVLEGAAAAAAGSGDAARLHRYLNLLESTPALARSVPAWNSELLRGQLAALEQRH